MSDLTFEEKVLNELRDLKERVTTLERSNMWNQPFGPLPTQPSMPQVMPWDPIPVKSTNKCSKCGIVMDGPMGYCCPHRDCPCGMGPVWSGVSELK